MSRIRVLLAREALVAFLVLGLVLYGVMRAVRPTASPEVIEVPAETILAIVEQQEMLAGRPLTADESRVAVEDYVDDEVLLREARLRGFDQNDGRVRKRLLTVMRSSLDEPVPEPSVAQLEAYYREQADRLRTAPAITFENVHFAWGSDRVPPDAAEFIERLEASADPAALGESTIGGARLSKQSRQDLLMQFGRAFADDVIALPLDGWRGPFESRAGVHYVRVLERHPPELAPFEQIEPYLREEWMFTERRAVQQKKLQKLREGYRVIMPDADRSQADAP